jgi:hypothetical protein
VETIDDLSEAERRFRELLSDPKRYAKWAVDVRARWAKTPAGLLAARMVDQRTGKKPRRIDIEEKQQ